MIRTVLALLALVTLAGCSIAAGTARSAADRAADRLADEIVGYCELSPEARAYTSEKVNGRLPREYGIRVRCPDGTWAVVPADPDAT